MFVIRVIPLGALDIPNAVLLRRNTSQYFRLCFSWNDVGGLGKARGEHQDDECGKSHKGTQVGLLMNLSGFEASKPDVLGGVVWVGYVD